MWFIFSLCQDLVFIRNSSYIIYMLLPFGNICRTVKKYSKKKSYYRSDKTIILDYKISSKQAWVKNMKLTMDALTSASSEKYVEPTSFVYTLLLK